MSTRPGRMRAGSSADVVGQDDRLQAAGLVAPGQRPVAAVLGDADLDLVVVGQGEVAALLDHAPGPPFVAGEQADEEGLAPLARPLRAVARRGGFGAVAGDDAERAAVAREVRARRGRE